MISLLLGIIYLSFISLGLPDSLLGSAWPSMYGELGMPVSGAGVLSMIIAGCTILSSLMSDRLIRRLGTGAVTAVSVGMTAVALFGFSVSHSFLPLCIWAFPYGLGAGSVDAALNNFVALNYKTRHMSWLHCFWGVGATLGPYVMGYCLTGDRGWNSGYRIISLFQIALTAILIFSLPLWKKQAAANTRAETVPAAPLSIPALLRLPGARQILTAFFCYCSLEQVTGLWGATYLVMEKGVSAEAAAGWICLFYLGITCGRFLSGFLTLKLNDRNMVRLGQAVAAAGILLLLLASTPTGFCAAFLLVGLGCAPIYPSLLHATPEHFGKDASQSIMGMQMAFAYVGNTISPPLAGLLAQYGKIQFLPLLLAVFVGAMASMTELKNCVLTHKTASRVSEF